MKPDTTESTGYYRFVMWVDANRQKLIWGGGFLAVVIVGISLFIVSKNQTELKASQAFSDLELPTASGRPSGPTGAAEYVALAKNDSDTTAAARALLRAGTLYYEAGSFKEARGQFENYLHNYGDNAFAIDASLGVAACYEGEGNVAEAVNHYSDILKRRPNDPMLNQAKASLARLYVEQGKPDQAFALYNELAKAGATSGDSWATEAGMQGEELLAKYPKLRSPEVMNVPGASPTMAPSATPTPAAPPKK